MIYLHDENLTLVDLEDLQDLTEIEKVQKLCGYEDDGIMHLETIQKLEAIAAKSTADLILKGEI